MLSRTLHLLISAIATRFHQGQPLHNPQHIFPNITRENADKDVTNMCKFLVNFFFAKFGIEVTFTMILVLASYRMDLVAMIYVLWLVALFAGDTKFKQNIWPFFRIVVLVLIFVQYLMVVGIPPFVCISVLGFFVRHVGILDGVIVCLLVCARL